MCYIAAVCGATVYVRHITEVYVLPYPSKEKAPEGLKMTTLTFLLPCPMRAGVGVMYMGKLDAADVYWPE
jgi:hypothetical protein